MDQSTKFNCKTGYNTDAPKDRTHTLHTHKYPMDKTKAEPCTTCGSDISIENLLLEFHQFKGQRS